MKLAVDEQDRQVRADPDARLPYVLAGDLKLNGPRFGLRLVRCLRSTQRAATECLKVVVAKSDP